MKKCFLFLFVLLLAISFAGCGGTGQGTKNESGSETQAKKSESVLYALYEIQAENKGQNQRIELHVYVSGNMVAITDKLQGGEMRVVIDNDGKKTYNFAEKVNQCRVFDFDEVRNPRMLFADPSAFIKPTGSLKTKIGQWECIGYVLDKSPLENISKDELEDTENEKIKLLAQMLEKMEINLWATNDIPKHLVDKLEIFSESMQYFPGMTAMMPMVLKDGVPIKTAISLDESIRVEMLLRELKEISDTPAGIFNTDTDGYEQVERPGKPVAIDGDDDDDDFEFEEKK